MNTDQPINRTSVLPIIEEIEVRSSQSKTSSSNALLNKNQKSQIFNHHFFSHSSDSNSSNNKNHHLLSSSTNQEEQQEEHQSIQRQKSYLFSSFRSIVASMIAPEDLLVQPNDASLK